MPRRQGRRPRAQRRAIASASRGKPRQRTPGNVGRNRDSPRERPTREPSGPSHALRPYGRHSTPPPREGPPRLVDEQVLLSPKWVGEPDGREQVSKSIPAPPKKPVKATVPGPPSPWTSSRAPRSPKRRPTLPPPPRAISMTFDVRGTWKVATKE